jgi:phosphoribosylaminoimidazole (AIR) synthetase
MVLLWSFDSDAVRLSGFHDIVTFCFQIFEVDSMSPGNGIDKGNVVVTLCSQWEYSALRSF